MIQNVLTVIPADLFRDATKKAKAPVSREKSCEITR